MFDIRELYRFASSVRRRFAEKLSEIPWSEVCKNREASFYNMRNILVHMIDNEDWIVNWVIRGRSAEYQRDKKSEDYTSMKMVMDHLNEVETKTKAYLSKVDDEELKRKINFTLRSGESFPLSVEESILQSFTEQLYHMGELIALLWEDNIEPPPMQWFRNNPREG